MKIIESKTVRTTVVRRIEINRETLFELLGPHTDCGDIPLNAAIYIQVPGGGDWSNTELDINNETPVIIAWTEVTEGEDV